MFLSKKVAALLIFVDLRSEGNRSLFKTENIINLSKDLDVHDGHRSSAANFIKSTDHRFTEKFLCRKIEVNEFEKKHPRKVHAVLTQYNRISFVLEACKFVNTFISLSLMSPFTPKASTADTI